MNTASMNGIIDLNEIFTLHAGRPAVARLGKRPTVFTFEDTALTLARLAGVLREDGVVRGTRVGIYAENSPLHFFLFFLAWVEGYVFVPLNPKAPFHAAIRDALPDVVILDDPERNGQMSGPGSPRFVDASALLNTAPTGHGPLPTFEPAGHDQACSLVFTSGSTGKARGVVHTIGNHVYSAAGVIDAFGLRSGERWIVSLPLNHMGGLSIFTRTLLSGGTAVFPETGRGAEAAIAGGAADRVSVVPTQLIRYMNDTKMVQALSSMRTILMGGAPAPGWVIDRARALCLPIAPSYGLTESCSLVTAVLPGSPAPAYKTAGKVLPHRELALDPDGRILLSGRTRFSHYIEDGEAVFPFDNGWFRTSDLGETDEDGNWVIRGRADEIFISGGENINPFEIENRITEIDGVDAAVVVPAPHPEFGCVPWVFVSMSETPGTPGLPDIRTHLEKALPRYKLPKKILWIEPGEATGPGIKTDRAYFKKKAVRMAGEP